MISDSSLATLCMESEICLLSHQRLGAAALFTPILYTAALLHESADIDLNSNLAALPIPVQSLGLLLSVSPPCFTLHLCLFALYMEEDLCRQLLGLGLGLRGRLVT